MFDWLVVSCWLLGGFGGLEGFLLLGYSLQQLTAKQITQIINIITKNSINKINWKLDSSDFLSINSKNDLNYCTTIYFT